MCFYETLCYLYFCKYKFKTQLLYVIMVIISQSCQDSARHKFSKSVTIRLKSSSIYLNFSHFNSLFHDHDLKKIVIKRNPRTS